MKSYTLSSSSARRTESRDAERILLLPSRDIRRPFIIFIISLGTSFHARPTHVNYTSQRITEISRAKAIKTVGNANEYHEYIIKRSLGLWYRNV